MIENPIIPRKVDRLSAFFDAFELSASLEPAPTAESHARLFVIGRPEGPAEKVILCLRGEPISHASALVTATVDFGGAHNPLMNALPDQVSVETNEAPALRDTTAAFVTEALDSRCGRSAALDRLCEVIVLLVLRSAIDRGAARPGLLAGLSHPALHRVLVVMHDAPARAWNIEDLALVAGMSRSHFMALFRHVVGTTPQAYLTGWRLTVARRRLSKGARIKAVARQVGFGSAAAFSRAYVRQFGEWPSLQMPSR
ncbi:AraC family transcriptional regulator [Agrobacterium rhizogenes]|uniref:Helix-turn-helix domain protein n=1 Tax=Rhizobium rhizogenes TaxID=359 RepID=A0A7S4ZUH8_RHIRH|nr:AraC family transcriptional regulator [Rhizobium rhizogenes]NTG30028.1 AraC family transcriptional regulator [Rhizobium rhizogenes]NTH66663.1 AraC family transcriptional regulator [Rhizobium rhizogenes]QCL09868.1 helix-turn-helix domain protein [Rhizobium rhizogenes]